MRNFLLLILFLSPSFLLASNSSSSDNSIESPVPASIKITSFLRVDPQNFGNASAEVCGQVSNFEGQINRLNIISDPGRAQGVYVTDFSKTGHFCEIIRTAYGQVDVVGVSTVQSSNKSKESSPKSEGFQPNHRKVSAFAILSPL